MPPHAKERPLSDHRLTAKLRRAVELWQPWAGYIYRFQTIHFPSAGDVLSGKGAMLRGGRWNARGIAAIYGCLSDEGALAEAKANDAYYGVITRSPRIVVCLRARLSRVLYLTEPKSWGIIGLKPGHLLREDWRKTQHAGGEALSQRLGRVARNCGAGAIIAPSAACSDTHNVVIFPPCSAADTVDIIDGELLPHRAHQE